MSGFSPKTKKEIFQRAGGRCEIFTHLGEIFDGVPEDFPQIDLKNPFHTALEYHHVFFRSAKVSLVHESWNGALIYKFYHDLIHYSQTPYKNILRTYLEMKAIDRKREKKKTPKKEFKKPDLSKKFAWAPPVPPSPFYNPKKNK